MNKATGQHRPADGGAGDPLASSEMRIQMHLDDWATFKGTAEQLHAKGLIPPGTVWPDADDDRNWQRSGLTSTLSRCRPDGQGGPKRTWLGLDHWSLVIEVTGRSHDARQLLKIDREARAQKARRHHLTSAGRDEFTEMWLRHWQAKKDDRFQDALSKIIGQARGRRVAGEGRLHSHERRGHQSPT